NYLEKPLDREHLLFTLQRACEHIALLRENTALHRKLEESAAIQGIIGDHPKIKEVFRVSTRSRLRLLPSLCMANPEPEKSWSHGPFMKRARGTASRSSPSTAQLFLKRSSKASFSGMRKAPLPAPTAASSDCSKLQRRARFFWTRSEK